jgi:hypothetical protein
MSSGHLTLKRVGFYKEMPHAEATDPSIFDYIHSSISSEEISKICSYLAKGTIIMSCCGTSSDIVDESKGIAGVPSMITDGTWLWPGDLVYYVQNYHLKLSEAFIEHMKANGWDVNVDEESLGSQDIVIQ